MKKISIGIEKKNIDAVVLLLSALLADETLLSIKTRNFHWNVTGPHFNDVHKMLEGQYDALAEVIDDIAERIRSLGAVAPGSMKEFLKLTQLSEVAGSLLSTEKMLSSLLADHEKIICALRKNLELCMDKYKDAGTSDFLTALMEQHEKTAWMLRATLGK